MSEINTIGSQKLKLLGFKPRSTLSLDCHVHTCAFVYPDEKRAKGSSNFFLALLESCRKKEVVAICLYSPRPSSTVRYVALDVNNSPLGFVMIILPFGDEVRKVDERFLVSEDKTAVSIEVSLVEKMIKKLRREFNPDEFPCPLLTAYWAGVEALALDLPETEDWVDSSVPDLEDIRNRLGNLTDDFNLCFYPEGYNPVHVERGKKPAGTLADIEKVEECVLNGTMNELSLTVLKYFLKSVGLGAGLSKKKKSELIQMVLAYLEQPSD